MTFDLSGISKNRQKLMEIAGLFIMFCHNSLYLPHWFYNINFGYLRYLFQIGVDMFMLFSGLGCYFSLSNNSSIMKFYKKRFLRLFPSYLIFFIAITVIYVFIDKQSVLQKMYSFSPFSFIISSDLTLWFIPAICILYFVSPILFRIINKINNAVFAFIGILIFYIIAIILLSFSVPYSNILLLRIPSFLFGMLIGYCEKRGKLQKFKTVHTVFLFSVFIISIVLYFFLTNHPIINSRVVFFPLCVTFTTIIASIIPDNNAKLLTFLGTITLETYLVHVPILSVTDFLSYRYINNDLLATYFSNISAVVISIIVAFTLNKTVEILSLKMKSKS